MFNRLNVLRCRNAFILCFVALGTVLAYPGYTNADIDGLGFD